MRGLLMVLTAFMFVTGMLSTGFAMIELYTGSTIDGLSFALTACCAFVNAFAWTQELERDDSR